MDAVTEAIDTGWVELRNGSLALITAIEPGELPAPFGHNPYPIVGRVLGSWEEHRWKLDGSYDEGSVHPQDIIRRRI